MKFVSVVVLAALATLAAQPAAAPAADGDPAARDPAPSEYTITAAWSQKRRVLHGTEEVSFTHLRPGTLEGVWFRLWDNSCRSKLISIRALEGGEAEKRSRDCTAVHVRLDEPLEPGESASVTLRFRVKVPFEAGRFGADRSGTSRLGNAIPILAVTDAKGTHLPPYVNFGESFYSLSAAWHVSLKLPHRIRALTTGTTESVDPRPHGQRRLQIEAPAARDFTFVFGNSSMHLTTGHAAGARIRVWDVLPSAKRYRHYAASVLRTAERALRIEAKWYGPYGRDELDVLLGTRIGGGGMEYPELVMIGIGADPLAGGRTQRRFARLVTSAIVDHEIAHQWWAMIVGDNSFAEPWLDEAFAEDANARLVPSIEPICGDGPALARYPSAVHLDSNVLQLAKYHSYDAIYYGGGCALQQLREKLGNSDYRTLLGDFVAAHRDGIATSRQFVAAVKAVNPAAVKILRRARLRAASAH